MRALPVNPVGGDRKDGADLERTKLLDRVFFNAVRDEKFKSNRISVNLITTLHHETAAQNAISTVYSAQRLCRLS